MKHKVWNGIPFAFSLCIYGTWDRNRSNVMMILTGPDITPTLVLITLKKKKSPMAFCTLSVFLLSLARNCSRKSQWVFIMIWRGRVKVIKTSANIFEKRIFEVISRKPSRKDSVQDSLSCVFWSKPSLNRQLTKCKSELYVPIQLRPKGAHIVQVSIYMVWLSTSCPWEHASLEKCSSFLPRSGVGEPQFPTSLLPTSWKAFMVPSCV